MLTKGSRRSQRGAGFWGLLFLLFVLGFFALLLAKSFPIYMNQFKVAKNVETVAKQVKSEGGQVDMSDVQRTLEKHWDIDDIEYLDYHDVHLIRTDRRRTLSYDYEAREHLFYNIFIVFHFKDDILIPGGD